MNRSMIAAVLGCLYAVLSVWIVRREGESFRDALRRERLQIIQTQQTSPRQPEAATTRTEQPRPNRREGAVNTEPAAITPGPVPPGPGPAGTTQVATVAPQPARPAD